MKFYLFNLLALSFLCSAESKFKDRFPDDFLFGFATASYQVEGAWNKDGKGENVWDQFVHAHPNWILDKSNGDIACNSYYKYKEDVKILKEVGAEVYRFSLSWSRILPNGDISKINPAGINYYNNLINELLENKIQPMVTLFHWDLPQPLQRLGGWSNSVLTKNFKDFARLAFKSFGDRVKWWITFNEPYEVCNQFYGNCYGAPCVNMTGIADYLCAHTIIKSHALAFHLYDAEFRKEQKGKVGITLNGGWNEPLTDSKADKDAAEAALEFQLGWFLHPIVGPGGGYPPIMRKRIDSNSKEENRSHSRLPHFDDFWKKYIKGSIDFLGINHYTTFLTFTANESFPSPSYQRDLNVSISQDPSWPASAAFWLKVEPTGFRKKLSWLKKYTHNFPIFITENGYADKGELNDNQRIKYYRSYLKELLKAIHNDGCNVIGYLGWSIIDNFEWLFGYTARFGIYHVDFESPNRTRTPKSSADFFKKLIKTRKLPNGHPHWPL